MDETTIENVRDYWNRRPCNVRHSDRPAGTLEYFDEVRARKYRTEPHIPGFAGFPTWKGKRVLEIGCGIGTDAIEFVRNGAIYVGCDLSCESIALTRVRMNVYGYRFERHHLSACDCENSLPDGKYDLAYSFGVLHHTPHPERIVANVKKCLASDGEFRLMLYAHNSWKRMMIDAGWARPEAQAGCPIARTYTHDQIRELLDGFEILEMRQAHIFPYRVDEYTRGRYVLEPWFAAMPSEMFERLEPELGWHTLIRCRLAG